MKNLLPRAVPLPEVADYTDEIVFRDMGFPQGFDEERINVNLRGIDRVMAAAGLGTILVHSVDGPAPEQDIQIGSMNANGTAAISAVASRLKNPKLGVGNVRFNNRTDLGKPKVQIAVMRNRANVAIDSKAHNKKGIMEPVAQALVLNNAVKAGLVDASKHANVDPSKLRLSAIHYGPPGLVIGSSYIAFGEFNTMLPINLLAINFLGRYAMLGLETRIRNNNRPAEHKLSGRAVLKNYRKSIFGGATLDRYLMGVVMAKTQTFITAAK